MSENERIAVVTGVGRSQGIGFEVCRQLAAEGVTVFLTARNPDAAKAQADQLNSENAGKEVRPFSLDITNPDEIKQLDDELDRSFGKLDILINNAASVGPFGEKSASADLEVAVNVLNTTLFGTWRLFQVLLPLLRQSGAGRIVNVSSGAGSHGDEAFGLTH